MKKILLTLVLMLLMVNSVLAVTVSINDYDPKPAEAGQFVNVWIKVENPKDEVISKTVVEVIPKDGLELSNGENAVREIGLLSYLDYSIVEYKLKVKEDAIEGLNTLSIKVDSEDGSYEQDFSINVEEKDKKEVILDVAKIESSPNKIKPGDDDVELNVYIQNLGDTSSKSTKLELSNLPEGVTFTDSYSNIELIGNIGDEGVNVATFNVDLTEDVVPGVYDLEAKATYKYKEYDTDDDYIIETVTFPIELRVKPVALFDVVNVEVLDDELRAGDKKVPLRITIKNIGLEDAESVRLKVYPKSEQPFEFTVNNNYVAPLLKPNETAQTTLEFDLEEDSALQTYVLDVEVKNVLFDDVVTHKKTIEVPVELAKKKSPVLSVVLSSAVGLAIFFGLLSFVAGGKKKGKRKH